LLEDAFIGTPKVQFLMPRGANFYRAADGLFHNEQYRSVDVVVTFIGESPHEALANPSAMQGKHCLAIAALNEFQPTD
jgi:hypothetical protein